MEKPRPKQEVAVRAIYRERGIILFDASGDAVDDLSEFGIILPKTQALPYWLIVDSRYDFGEVLNYIEHYGEDE